MYWYNKSAVLEVRIPSQDFFLKWNRNILKTRMHRNEVQAAILTAAIPTTTVPTTASKPHQTELEREGMEERLGDEQWTTGKLVDILVHK